MASFAALLILSGRFGCTKLYPRACAETAASLLGRRWVLRARAELTIRTTLVRPSFNAGSMDIGLISTDDASLTDTTAAVPMTRSERRKGLPRASATIPILDCIAMRYSENQITS